MTEQQPGTEVAVPLQPMIEQWGGEFGKVLPAHVGAERFQRWSLSLLKQAMTGQQADTWRRVMGSPAGQASLMSAFLDCASLGLEPGRTYHLVPYGDQVTGIIDYKGEIQLIHNANPDASVVGMLVRKADEFYLTGANIPPRHDADWFNPEARGPIVGGYAYVDYGGRYSIVVRMAEADFLRHRDKARAKGIWDEHPEPMRVKTMFHQLRKTEPWSAEVRPRRDER